MSTFEEYAQQKLSDVAKSTLVKRLNFLKRVSDGSSNFSFINDTDKMEKMLNAYENPATRWNNLMHIVAAVKADPSVIKQDTKTWLNEYSKIVKDSKDHKQTNNVMTTKQKGRLDKPLDEYQTMIRKLLDNLFDKYNIKTTKTNLPALSGYCIKQLGDNVYPFMKAYQDILILAMYIIQEPLRANYSTMRFTFNVKKINDTDNWMVLDAKNMVFSIFMNDFKNVSHFGKAAIRLNVEIQYFLCVWATTLKRLLGKDPEHILHYEISKKFHTVKHINSDAALAKNIPRIAKRLLGKELSINDYRHMWEIAIQIDPRYAMMTIEERDAIHHNLLHSRGVAELYNVQKRD